MIGPDVILSIAGTLLIITLGIIGYFIKRLIDVVDNLEIAVNNMSTVVRVQETKMEDSDKVCVFKHKTIDKRLNDHSQRIGINERNITTIKTKLTS